MTHLTKKVHGFPVRTPICHIVPISRMYKGELEEEGERGGGRSCGLEKGSSSCNGGADGGVSPYLLNLDGEDPLFYSVFSGPPLTKFRGRILTPLMGD